jgi:cytoskeleton protein RodZ
LKEKKDIPAARGVETEPQTEPCPELKAAREARGLALKDVFEATRISMLNLEALEAGRFDRLPPPVYARSFIRRYARVVGIDEQPILARYERYLEGLKPRTEETEIRKPWPERGRRTLFLSVSLAAVIIAGVLVYAFFLYDQCGEGTRPAPSIETPPEKEIAGPAPGSPGREASLPESPVLTAAPPAAAEPAAAKPADPGKRRPLVIEARELTWVRITEDGKTSTQALLRPGERIERSASDHFLLDIGNAGGIQLTFEGKPLGSPGKSGQVIHLRLPEKSGGGKPP